jgi:hypothetical protein
VAGDDPVVGIYQHRIVEAEPRDAIGNLADLLARMGSGITLVGGQL